MSPIDHTSPLLSIFICRIARRDPDDIRGLALRPSHHRPRPFPGSAAMSVAARHKAEGLQGEVGGADVGGNGRLALMARSVMGARPQAANSRLRDSTGSHSKTMRRLVPGQATKRITGSPGGAPVAEPLARRVRKQTPCQRRSG